MALIGFRTLGAVPIRVRLVVDQALLESRHLGKRPAFARGQHRVAARAFQLSARAQPIARLFFLRSQCSVVPIWDWALHTGFKCHLSRANQNFCRFGTETECGDGPRCQPSGAPVPGGRAWHWLLIQLKFLDFLLENFDLLSGYLFLNLETLLRLLDQFVKLFDIFGQYLGVDTFIEELLLQNFCILLRFLQTSFYNSESITPLDSLVLKFVLEIGNSLVLLLFNSLVLFQLILYLLQILFILISRRSSLGDKCLDEVSLLISMVLLPLFKVPHFFSKEIVLFLQFKSPGDFVPRLCDWIPAHLLVSKHFNLPHHRVKLHRQLLTHWILIPRMYNYCLTNINYFSHILF